MPPFTETRECFQCGETGHLKAGCPQIRSTKTARQAEFFVAVARELSAAAARASPSSSVGPRGPVPANRGAAQRGRGQGGRGRGAHHGRNEQQQQQQQQQQEGKEEDLPDAPGGDQNLRRLVQRLQEQQNQMSTEILLLRDMIVDLRQQFDDLFAPRGDDGAEGTCPIDISGGDKSFKFNDEIMRFSRQMPHPSHFFAIDFVEGFVLNLV
ncbi:hypothetical protein BP00DRAFT_494781 [Aspergillus indologenus CBS 114.80]|uniref:CCHC-type domain-containing protein n=1 Tax=Aspergillus indologenus CBS 114.80 TaxID=1450541 RepID=A0A2V5ID54_9EURO|nr:hypothetical protein BP00DRAFT_494781 [Aspergillus indologenus CBS 114.80]